MLKKNPLVSVIINCHNGEKYLKDCINSIIHQTYKNWEIIFFDNNSTDTSHKILREYNDKRIKYHKSKKTFSLYKARNLAVKLCRGELVTFLDVDDWWIKKKLKTQIKVFQKNYNLDILYSNIFLFFEKTKKKKIFIKKIINKNLTQNLINKFEMPIQTVMIKKNFFQKLKFNNKYTIIGDFDYFIRASVKGKIIGLNEPLAYYRYHENNLTTKKISLNVKELEHWIRYIKKKNDFINIDFKNIYNLINLLKIKKLIINKKIKTALIQIIKSPIGILRIKFLFLAFLSLIGF